MIPQLLGLLNDNKGVATVITALTVVALLGGTGNISLPADKAVAELNNRFVQYEQFDSQRYEMHELEWTQRQIGRMLRDLSWFADAANRRTLTPDEEATLHDLRLDLQGLKEYERELKARLKGDG